MDQTNNGFSPEALRLIGAALALQQATSTAANIVPLPGTDRFVAIGTAGEVARLLEIAPARQVGCGGTGDFVGSMPCPGCDACLVEHDLSEGGHHD